MTEKADHAEEAVGVSDLGDTLGRDDSVGPVGIVADDLTGATDSAVQFARAGWKTRLALTMPTQQSAEPGSAIAFVTDARAEDAAPARAVTAKTVEGLHQTGVGRLFLKIDSTLRGSVINQIHGALDAWSNHHHGAIAIVCSAYPALGRTIEDGHLLVNGEAVHTTSIGRDPVTPLKTSEVAKILPGSIRFQLDEATTAENAARLVAATEKQSALFPSRIVSVDAKNDDEIARLAETIAHLGPKAIPAGSAGLAIPMSRTWDASASLAEPAATNWSQLRQTTGQGAGAAHMPRVIVVVSSLHDVSRAQVDELLNRLETDQVGILAPALRDVLATTSIREWARKEIKKDPSTPLPSVLLVLSPADRPMNQPSGSRSAPELIAESLAIITEEIFNQGRIDAMVLLGGEGARAVLDHLGAQALIVHDAVQEGIPRSTLEGGVADDVTVITKAGGFGVANTVADIVRDLTSITPPGIDQSHP